MFKRKRFVQVGLGGRHMIFRDAVIREYSESCEMTAFCDTNPGRLKLALDTVRNRDQLELAGYESNDYEKMIKETKPDCVIVTSLDNTHDHYICRAMELGCDVISEKPMTIDEKRCRRILDTKRKTGRTCTVTFNYRYSPPRVQIKELLMSGVIGDVQSVDFHWMLDTHHGADYFRRWHRRKANSGGLMVHKATHHFDLVNWWLSTVPQSVYAMGRRSFYTPKTAERFGLNHRATRCLKCPEAGRCPFHLDIKNGCVWPSDELKRLYYDCEKYDGYYRDQCVFSDSIDIEDSMSVIVRYANGVEMSYSLNAYSPWEGYRVCFNGTRGRLEHKYEETAYINADGSIPGQLNKERTWIKVHPHWKPAYDLDVWEAEGGHGGGDTLLLEGLFEPQRRHDKYKRMADERAGAWSILTGIAANHSMAENRSVRIDELIDGLEMPDYTLMPRDDESLPLPNN